VVVLSNMLFGCVSEFRTAEHHIFLFCEGFCKGDTCNCPRYLLMSFSTIPSLVSFWYLVQVALSGLMV